ncbi:MAG: hypothetical protein H0T78_06595 [Longispora sp.]|nr:hypothetical protein [Longispora sp. (in: high G+C Gram-positive bacteria)]
MVTAIASVRKPGSLTGWIVDGLCAIVSAIILNVVVIVGIFAYGVGHSQSIRIPGYMEIVVDDKGGFEAGTHDGVLLSFLALTLFSLLVARMMRHGRKRNATRG